MAKKKPTITCISQTALESPACIPPKIAAPNEEMYSISSTGGVFSSKVSLYDEKDTHDVKV